MEKIEYIYHMHTARCEHATGEDEEYVKAAIRNGVKRLGFSDHIFFPHHTQRGIRGDFSCLEEYVSSIRLLKEKYKNVIDIKVGFEVEYIDMYVQYYKDLLSSKTIDYMILGQHNYIDMNNDVAWYLVNKDDDEELEHYCKDLIKGIESGLFSFVCHPDLFANGITVFSPKAEEISKRIIEAAIKANVPLEINLGGYRHFLNSDKEFKIPTNKRHLPYPLDDFWRIVSKYKDAKVIINSDAHEPTSVYRDSEYQYAFSLIKKYNLNLIKDFSIK